jgi:recombination protein RecR
MAGQALDDLIQQLAKLPGLGPRSARRAALHLLKQRETLLVRLAASLTNAATEVRRCTSCGNLDSADPCWICADPERDRAQICVVEQVDDLWAVERAGLFRGCYHVLGGTLSAINGTGPEDLRVDRLLERIRSDRVGEVILATSATVDGQITAHYLADRPWPAGRRRAELSRRRHARRRAQSQTPDRAVVHQRCLTPTQGILRSRSVFQPERSH